MANCTNHATVEGAIACAACRLPFCADCTIDFRGTAHCGPCKNRAVRQSLVRAQFKLPREALLYSLVGLIPCFSLFLQPVAIYKAAKALSQIGSDPTLPGKGMAISAMIISIAFLALFLLMAALWIILMGALVWGGLR